MADELATRSLLVNVLVNNAGFSTMGPVYRSDPVAELAMVRTDVEAVVHLCSLFLPGMVERRSGCVLNVASTAAFQPLPGQAGYGASKAFVLSYSHALRGEVRGTGVTVTVLCPGPVDTGFAAAAGISDEEAAQAMPKFMWVPAGEVAKAAVAGMDADRAVVIPGLANRISAAAGWLSPRSASGPHGGQAAPRAAHLRRALARSIDVTRRSPRRHPPVTLLCGGTSPAVAGGAVCRSGQDRTPPPSPARTRTLYRPRWRG